MYTYKLVFIYPDVIKCMGGGEMLQRINPGID